VRPNYPESSTAQTAPIAVSLEATIGVDGTVTDARVTTAAPPEFEEAAVAAVRQWEFSPTLLNCEAIEVHMNVSVSFTP
jgi:protein TonB